MEKAVLKVVGNNATCSQVITAFYLLGQSKFINLKIENHIHDNNYPYHSAFLEVEYKDNLIVYDMLDGYQNKDIMQWFLGRSDFYFKRSFSRQENEYFGKNMHKIHPLGFNYHISYKRNPINEPISKSMMKLLLGKKPQYYFTPKVYECPPVYKKEDIKVSYWARLWEEQDNLTEELKLERLAINEMRVNVVKELSKEFGQNYIGGLSDSPLARKAAPEYIVERKYSDKSRYIEAIKNCDIGVATLGLHKSAGWKIGEYISASLAIVSEKFQYTVPGDFEKNKNYLEFADCYDCVNQVRKLFDSPNKLYEMKKNNNLYYKKYLEPRELIKNTLLIVDEKSNV